MKISLIFFWQSDLLISGIFQSDIDQDDLGSDHFDCRSSPQGAPQYKRLVAINAGKAECGSRNSPTPQELKHHRSRERNSLQDLLVKDTSKILEEGQETDERVKQHWNSLFDIFLLAC